MIRALPYIAPITIGGLAAWYVMDLRADKVSQAAEIASLTRSLSAMEAQADTAALARRVEAARASGALKREADANATIDAIQSLELGDCADEIIDPTLRDLINGRVVPRATD